MACRKLKPICMADGALRTYGIYWGDNLADGDSLASVMWDVPAGLTKIAESVNSQPVTEDGVVYPPGTVALVRLRRDAAGTYACRCEIATAQGDADSRELVVVAN